MNKWTKATEATLSEPTFNQLRALIREHVGISFRDNKRYLLESRVRSRLLACQVEDYEAYVRYLRENKNSREMTHLVNAVTINETSFYRNPAQFEALAQDLLPTLIAQRRREGTRRVRLWSAACSTGDEAYSLAIIIKERLKPRFPHVQFDIVATDIDTDVLDTARAGRYRARAVRNVPTAYLHKLFQRDGDAYVLHSSVRDMVTFRQLNLVDPAAMRSMRNFDVVMCANVLIYFNESKKKRVLQSLRRALRPGGYLFVGGSEALGGSSIPFAPVRTEGALAYQRPQTSSAASTARNSPSFNPGSR